VTVDTDSIVDRVRTLLDPEEAGVDVFVGARGELGLPRIFGGQVLAQALMAAARTVPDARPAHSLHGYFLRGGDPRHPVTYAVERIRDGRRLASRTVSAYQGEVTLATAMISFADTTGTINHQRPAPVTVPVETVPSLAFVSEAWGGLGPSWAGFDLLDVRVDPREAVPGVDRDLPQWTDHVWYRIPARLPDDPVLHQALLLYASDVMQLAAALVPHGMPVGREELDGVVWDGVSLDHALWWHRPARADEWLLFEQCSPIAATGRALTRAEVFTATGDLVATVVQEGLIADPGQPV
jgi:acyl-CoA thioesterase II